MAILKIKDENGNFIGVPAITGESGVRLSETEPANENVKVWINPSGETQTIPTMTSELRNDSNFVSWNENEVLDETLLFAGEDYGYSDLFPILNENINLEAYTQLKIIVRSKQTGFEHCVIVPTEYAGFPISITGSLASGDLYIESAYFESDSFTIYEGESYERYVYALVPRYYKQVHIDNTGNLDNYFYEANENFGYITEPDCFTIRYIWGLRHEDRLYPEGWNN